MYVPRVVCSQIAMSVICWKWEFGDKERKERKWRSDDSGEERRGERNKATGRHVNPSFA